MDQVRSDTHAPGVEPARRGFRGRLEHRDPGLRATTRALRAAVMVPTVFAIAKYGTSNVQTPLFAVFGAAAILLFANFGGARSVRTRAYLGLWVVGAVFVIIGTLSSTQSAVAVVSMGVVGFLVLYAGVASPLAAAGSTAALLTFVLAVVGSAPASTIPDRLLGWVLAGVLSIPAALLVGTARWHDPLRQAMVTAARAIADHLSAPVDPSAPADAPGARSDQSGVEGALGALRSQYEATPYRPMGAGPTDVPLTNLVSRLEWVGACATRATADIPRPEGAPLVADVSVSAAGVLYATADLLSAVDQEARTAASESLSLGMDRLAAAREMATDAALAEMIGTADGREPEGAVEPPEANARRSHEILAEIDPTYPTRILAFALEMMAEAILEARRAREHDRARFDRWRASVRHWAHVAAGQGAVGSVWFRNASRGGVAMALAVLVTEVTTVQHGFWVVLGTISVLRSNAVGTGSTALRAVIGTVTGFVIGAIVLWALGSHDTLLWIFLPVALLVAALAPAAVSFTVGQAGFTVFVVMIFNLVQPVGYSVGLVRVEDVAIGAGVSVVVGLLFWPRGAAAALAHALGEAYAAATAWMVVAVDRVGRDPAIRDGTSWSPERNAATGAAERLDDAYRQFLSERGAKQIPQPIVTRLLTGCAQVRLTAATLDGLPVLRSPEGLTQLPEVQVARVLVTHECEAVEKWFAGFATSIGMRDRSIVAPPPVDALVGSELVTAWRTVRRDGRRDGIFAVLRLLWIEERMDDLRALQADLVSSAGAVGRPRN